MVDTTLRSLLAVLVIFPAVAPAQDGASKGLLDRLQENGLQVRKSFTGSAKEAGLPAQLTYDNPDTGSTYHSIDFGIKLRELPPKGRWGGDAWAALMFPTIEYHASQKPLQNEIKKSEVGLTFEIERASGPDEDAFSRMFFSDLQFNVSRDSIQDETTRSSILRFGFYDVSSDRGPGNDIRIGPNRGSILVWLPTVGLEDYQSLPIKGKQNGETIVIADAVDAAFSYFRMNIELLPFSERLDGRLSFVSTITARHTISGDAPLPDSTRLYEVSLDYYLDSDRRFGVGLSYQNGRDPSRNFLDEEFSSLGFKVKMGK